MTKLWHYLAAQLRAKCLTRKQIGAATAIFAVVLSFAVRAARTRAKPLADIALSATVRLLNERAVQELVYSDGNQLIVQLKPAQVANGIFRAGARYVTRLVPGSEAEIFKLAREVPSFRYVAPARSAGQVLSAFIPFILVAVWYKMVKSLISKDESYSPPPRRGVKPRQAITFADVACKSKVELAEIVDYLNKPQRYKQAGARLPRGALLVGPSGTGKTLLAKAVAGEAKCAFISTSASEFVEVYVGRGAARVRDLFRQAREAAPSVLFMDELDALGARGPGRESGIRGPNEEYVQLLNQLLTELDGFHGHEDGIVVIGATNRHEAIDAALLRPGRFDRHIFVELPDEEERFEILVIHSRKAPMLSELEPSALKHLAEATSGFSGAELANVINEAIFLAMRERRVQVGLKDLTGALNRTQDTRQRRTSAEEAAAPHAGFARSFLSRQWPIVTATAVP